MATTTRAASGSPTPTASLHEDEARGRRDDPARGAARRPADRRHNPLSRGAGTGTSARRVGIPERPLRTILVIEDEPQIASLVRDYLEHAGFAVLTAGDGAGGLALARARRPDADRARPRPARVDGLDVVRALRRDSTVPS